MTIDGRRARLLLGTLRLGVAGGFAAPGIAARVLGLEPGPHSAYLVRLWAARNVAMATGLWVSAPPARRLWWQAGILCDALDVGAALLALREGKPRASAAVDAGAALTGTALGLAGLLSEGRAR
jgi:hypothetical protein